MIDDTPSVAWSSAWWRKWAIGVAGAFLLFATSLYGFATAQTFGIGRGSYKMWFFPIAGTEATFMSLGHLRLAVAGFAYGYCHYSERLNTVSDSLLALGLVTAMIGITLCNLAPILGF